MLAQVREAGQGSGRGEGGERRIPKRRSSAWDRGREEALAELHQPLGLVAVDVAEQHHGGDLNRRIDEVSADSVIGEAAAKAIEAIEAAVVIAAAGSAAASSS